ncbi:macrophage mannose receptor 1-like [Xiphophorus couchianus]|uniref:macrophage mannose receptor 1-like n=1 Tax=Xiphophorus couchianus TaxID=32473 RepID=UPI00101634D8|nr:macrophage mannose receptor 1-like [Xiphophorus couchianus]XP_027894818.1 macrophage mannose receptor 1-like [Xiphophorus couchianus]
MRKVSVFLLTERFILSTCDQHQYHFVSGSFTWSEAQAYCRQKHTDLATIQSFTEVERVLETLSSAGHTSEVWIGLYSEMDWRWSDGFTGSGAEYRDWETSDDEPDFYYAYQFCVLIAKNGKYWDDSCSISYPFICYNGTQENPEYVLVNEPRSWSDAQKYCRQNFRDLATIRNHTENQRAQSLLPSPAFVWIGLFRDPNFHWSDGSRFVYRNWADVFNVIGSNRIICGVTWSPGQWRFRSCETKRSFVCHSLPEMKRLVKLRLKTEDSVNLNDPLVMVNILKKLQDRLNENGMSGTTLKWREQPDGDVFKKKKAEL